MLFLWEEYSNMSHHGQLLPLGKYYKASLQITFNVLVLPTGSSVMLAPPMDSDSTSLFSAETKVGPIWGYYRSKTIFKCVWRVV